MNKKNNVLMVGSSLSVKGGITTVIKGFLENKFNDIILYYVPTYTEGSRLKQIIYYLYSVIKIIYYLIVKKIDIVHIHVSERGSFYRKNIIFNISKFFHKKIITHMHGAEFKEFYSNSSINQKHKIIKFLVESDKVIALGDSWSKYIQSLDSKIDIEIMQNFVSEVKETSTFNTNKVNILFLAVVTKRKGIFDLVESVSNLVKYEDIRKYKIKVIIAGSGVEEESVKKKVIEKGLEEYFDFRGWIDNTEKINTLLESQIFVLPSYNEGLPVSILEAMSYGIPIISTNVGSIEDAVKDDYNGIIINPGNIDMLTDSIIRLIKNKRDWEKFSINNKLLVSQKYNSNIYFDNMENIYKSIIGKI